MTDPDPPYTGSTQWDLHPAEPDCRRVDRWILATAWGAAFGCFLFVAWVSLAHAAEVPRPHEITLHFKGKDYDKVRRTHLTLGVNGKPAIYESYETCKVAIVRVRVAVSGARLVCRPVE